MEALDRIPALKRTPIRFAALFTIVFSATFVALFLVLFVGISARLNEHIRQRTRDTMTTLITVDTQESFDNLQSVVEGESASVRDADFIYELVDRAGRHLAGNVRLVPSSRPWIARHDISAHWSNGDPDDAFFVVENRVSEGRLLVGSSNRELRRLQSFLVRMLAVGLAVTTLLGALCGFVLAKRTRGRIDAFAETLAAVSRGSISARVPMTGAGDDIDSVARQVNGTLDHLQRLIETVKQSSSHIAHDLKKPVGRLQQRLDAARRSSATVEDFRHAVTEALGDLSAIMQTFEALLRITQIEAGVRKSRFKAVDLADVLEEVTEIYAPVAEDAGHHLAPSQLDARPAPVWGDRDLLMQLCANLIENAIRHCPPPARIALTLENARRGYKLTCSDDGPGIPPSERANVFRRLYRLERARTTDGSGLGLTLVAAIAELHDATIALEGEKGLSVVIHMPELTARSESRTLTKAYSSGQDMESSASHLNKRETETSV